MLRDPDVQASEVSGRAESLVGRTFLALVFLVGLGIVGCATANALSETPMNTPCLEVPSVEECRTAAAVITNVCLRQCVEAQCSGVKVICDPYIQERCKALNEGKKGKVGGFVVRKKQTCLTPANEICMVSTPHVTSMPRQGNGS